MTQQQIDEMRAILQTFGRARLFDVDLLPSGAAQAASDGAEHYLFVSTETMQRLKAVLAAVNHT